MYAFNDVNAEIVINLDFHIMKFVIITHVPHIIESNKYFAYAPYVSEMNIWSKYVEELVVVAPIVKSEKTPVDTAYEHQNIQFIAIEAF